MAFKDILVHIDNSEQSATRLDLAITLVKEHQSPSDRAFRDNSYSLCAAEKRKHGA